MKFPRKVYCIRHNPTERVYIGSSANVDRRIGAHISALRRGSHINEDMQADYNRHGEDYTITVLDSIENMSEVEKEYEWMKMYESNVRGKGYNYKDQKDVGALKPKKRDLEAELLQIIKESENPDGAILVVTKLMANFLLLAELGEGSKNTFGNRLKMLREGSGMTQEKLAQTIGTSKSSINMYERGEREPGIDTILAMANHFGVSTDYLLGRRN